MPKTTIKIDSELLQRFRPMARVLGISLGELIEEELEASQFWIDLENGGLNDLSMHFITDVAYSSRKQAEGVAKRFEAHAIQAKLDGKDVGMITTEVVPTDDGRWTIEVHHLAPAPGESGWRKITVLRDEDDDDEGEEWKE